jgi:hypothetical protein
MDWCFYLGPQWLPYYVWRRAGESFCNCACSLMPGSSLSYGVEVFMEWCFYIRSARGSALVFNCSWAGSACNCAVSWMPNSPLAVFMSTLPGVTVTRQLLALIGRGQPPWVEKQLGRWPSLIPGSPAGSRDLIRRLSFITRLAQLYRCRSQVLAHFFATRSGRRRGSEIANQLPLPFNGSLF